MLIEERPAGDAELIGLLDAAFQELVSRYGPEGRSSVHAEARFLVVVVDGRAVGCGALQPTTDPGTGELKRMYVAPQHRGRGVASALLAAIEEMGRRLGYHGIRLSTGLKQPEAIALYEKHGYGLTAPYGKYVGDPVTRCYHKPLPVRVPGGSPADDAAQRGDQGRG